MTNELDGLVKGLKAEIMGAIHYHRSQNHGRLYNPGPGGPVSPFLDSIAAAVARYVGKLATMRALGETPAAEIDAAEIKINALADAEIERAQSTNKNEFAD